MSKDANGIFDQKLAIRFVKKYIDASPKRCLSWHMKERPDGKWGWLYDEDGHAIREYDPIYGTENIKKFSKYMTRTFGNLYVRMLECIEHQPCSYHEIYAQVLKPRGTPFGNDTLLFNSLEHNGFVELDHLGKWKRRFFRLSPLGKLILDTARANHAVYKVLRHFLKFDGNDFEFHMMSIETNLETIDDVTPSAFIEMLDAILDPASKLHEIGSYFYWCNKLVECLKKKPDFFNLFNCPEVRSWLDSKSSSNANAGRFNTLFNKIAKKHAKTHAQSLAA